MELFDKCPETDKCDACQTEVKSDQLFEWNKEEATNICIDCLQKWELQDGLLD